MTPETTDDLFGPRDFLRLGAFVLYNVVGLIVNTIAGSILLNNLVPRRGQGHDYGVLGLLAILAATVHGLYLATRVAHQRQAPPSDRGFPLGNLLVTFHFGTALLLLFGAILGKAFQ